MKYCWIILAVLFSLSLEAQNEEVQKRRQDQKEKMEAIKVAHITKTLELTAEEAEKFWPIYNKHMAERKAMMMRPDEQRKKNDELSEEEAANILKENMAKKRRALQMEEELISNLKGVISNRKILRLTMAEKRFKQKVMSSYKKKKHKKHKKARKEKNKE